MTSTLPIEPPHSTWNIASEPSLVHFDELRPNGSLDWSIAARGQNFVIEYVGVPAGSRIVRDGQVDEYFVVVPDEGARIEVGVSGERVGATGPAACVVPSGYSEVLAVDDVRLFLVFTARTSDVVERAVNASAYRTPNPAVAPLRDGEGRDVGVQVYELADIPVDPSRFGRAFRTRDLMVNFINPRHGPRDPSAMSPHVHDDFEQGSLAISGEYVHHIRRSWSQDIAHWRPDRHLAAGPNSIVVIPPLHVHTSQAIGADTNLLIDVFAPPRDDLVGRQGFVLNASSYADG